MTPPGFADFFELPLVGILRNTSIDSLPALIEAVRKGGIRYLEITMNTPGATEQIKLATHLAGGEITIGAGTVISQETLDRALNAGARFIVTPAIVPDVLESCEHAGIPIFPGALTPTEIITAQRLAPIYTCAIKVFPADSLGPSYIRSLKGPFPDSKLMPTGGVDLQNVAHFLAAGASAFGIGSPLFQKDQLKNQNWTWLENQARAFVETYRSSLYITPPPT
jgi:2-dehydro-3-deoxyphosphogluconate aldolase/(4S)-4-hydroxy-2-oxoglutarate aldolase